MSREFDRRTFSGQRLTPEREANLRALAVREGRVLPGTPEAHIVSFDAVTGNPAEILGAAPADPGDYVQRAVEYLGGFRDTLGFAPTQPTEFKPDPHVQTTSSGAAAVHVQQLYKGIPIFQANQAVQFNPQGAIEGTLGQSVSIDQEQDPTPSIGADTATLIAARYVAAPQEPAAEAEYDQFGQPLQAPRLQLAGYGATIISSAAERADQLTQLSPGPFAEPPRAGLVWFHDDPALDLAWEVVLTLPDASEQYRVLVDAATGDLLYCHQLVHHVAAQGNVYLKHGDTPRQFVAFPLPRETYGLTIPADLPPGFPGTWVDFDVADGNNAYAHLDDNGPTVGGTVIDGAVVFNPRLPSGNAQRILNLFYYVNCMHNFFYMLGFREADGNFQVRNTSPGGLPSDPVDARVYSGFVNGTATMTTSVDGRSPIMRTGLVSSTGRHTALDATVIYHEYTHGVTNRLVGGPLNDRALDAVQSQAFGEGSSDFFACIAAETNVVGAWVVGNADGIRSAPYTSAYPAHFGNLGQGQFRGIHASGEIWCAALMELSRTIDKTLCLQLVMDALKLMPANPTFLQSRDAILRALDHSSSAGIISAATYTTSHAAIWRAFARYGMGPNASCPHAFTLSGMIPDFNVPAPVPFPLVKVEAEPIVAIGQPNAVTHPTPVDDFSQLPELDERSEHKLQSAGIISFADLAACTPAQLARIIAKRGMNAERISALGWVEAARKHVADQAGARPLATTAPTATTEAPSDERQRTTSFTIRLNIRADRRVRKLEIFHARDGAHSEWDSWNEQGLLAFIQQHADLRTDATAGLPPAHTSVTRRLPDHAPAAPDTDAAPLEPANARLTGETLSQPQGDDQLRVKLQFQIIGAVGPALYVWQILARHRDTGHIEVLATREGELAVETPEQQVSAVVDLPKTDGRYRLSGILRIPERQIFLEVPGPPLSVEAS